MIICPKYDCVGSIHFWEPNKVFFIPHCYQPARRFGQSVSERQRSRL